MQYAILKCNICVLYKNATQSYSVTFMSGLVTKLHKTKIHISKFSFGHTKANSVYFATNSPDLFIQDPPDLPPTPTHKTISIRPANFKSLSVFYFRCGVIDLLYPFVHRQCPPVHEELMVSRQRPPGSGPHCAPQNPFT